MPFALHLLGLTFVAGLLLLRVWAVARGRFLLTARLRSPLAVAAVTVAGFLLVAALLLCVLTVGLSVLGYLDPARLEEALNGQPVELQSTLRAACFAVTALSEITWVALALNFQGYSNKQGALALDELEEKRFPAEIHQRGNLTKQKKLLERKRTGYRSEL